MKYYEKGFNRLASGELNFYNAENFYLSYWYAYGALTLIQQFNIDRFKDTDKIIGVWRVKQKLK